MAMEAEQIDNILQQIEEGRLSRDYKYQCCGVSFETKYDFYKHLHECHKEEYNDYFSKSFHVDSDLIRAPHIKGKKKSAPKKVSGYKKFGGKIELTTRQCELLSYDKPPYPACKRCGAPTSNPYYYKESSVGPIYLCDACNFKLRHPKGEYHRKVDGHFEANK